MKLRYVHIWLIFVAVLVSTGSAQGPSTTATPTNKPPIPIYITPFYDSEGPRISVGQQSKKLTIADEKTIVEISTELKNERDKLRPEVMYVLAIRLYDFGQKDEAVYWFYTAQYRSRVFSSILDKGNANSIGAPAFELEQAYNSFFQLAGPYINGYAFGDLVALEKTLSKVIEDGKSMPNYGELYPKIVFVPEEKWADSNNQVSQGLNRLIDHIKTDADSIKEQRKKKGIEGKY